jgi:drug/metabolite transporter (DMT)-like permease
MSPQSHTLPRSTWLLLSTLTLGWGFNWPTMKIALAQMPVWTFRGLCVLGGAVGMFALMRATRLPVLPPRGYWPRLALTALFNVTLWNVFIAYGLTYLPAGRSVILAYTMPLWTMMLSALLLHEPLTRRRLLGAALGTAGMAVLLGHELSAVRAAPVGAMLVVAAALSWAIGTVLMKRYPTPMPTASFTGWQLLIGGAPIVLGALILDADRSYSVDWRGFAALAYNIVVAFVYCYWAWFKVLGQAPAGVSALGTLMIPVVGVFSSMLVLGERPSAPEYAALALVLGSIATVLLPGRKRVDR